MPEQATAPESTVSDEQIDAILEGSSEGESGEEGSGQEGATDDLSYHLQTIGLSKDDIPTAVPEEARALVEKVARKADERIRGMQSGFQQATREVQEKALRFDQLMANPDFRDFMSGGRQPEPKSQGLSDIDMDSLPTDPVKRAEAIIALGAKNALGPDVQAVRQEISALKTIMGNMVWENFKASHPGAAEGQAVISQLVSSGLSLDQAYKAYQGMNTDPAAIRDDTLKAVQRRMREKQRAAGLPMNTLTRGTDQDPDTVSRVNKLAEQQGNRQTFLQLLAENAEKVGY